MASPRRIGRWVIIGLGGAVVLVLVLRVGAGAYLHSASGRTVVGQRLGSMIGLPVEVGELDVGSHSTSISFRVLDPALGTSPGGGVAVVAVESASADVSFADLVTGQTHPKELHLSGVNLALRMDARGKILTTLPTPSGGGGDAKLPVVTVENGKIALAQEGRPEFVLGGLTLRAEPAGDKLVVTGSVDDPEWGKWKVTGEVTTATKAGWIELAAGDAPLKLDLLRSIPGIPHSVWDNAQPAGRGAATIRLAVGPDDAFKYDVRVVPKGATLGLPAAEVTLADVNGVVRFTDGRMEVGGETAGTRATGTLAGGTVAVGVTWDFDKEPAVADPLAVTVERLVVKDLPAKWGLKTLGGQLPGKLNMEAGVLSGSAKLKLLVHADNRVETYGGGTGEIRLPTFLGGKAKLGVTLGGDGKKLGFNLGAPPPAKDAGATLPPEPSDTLHVEVTSPSELVALAAVLAVQPKTDPTRTDQTDLDATITLRDIDIAQFIEQLELKVPYKVAGKVTVRAKLGVPLGEATTPASYRLTGTLRSPEIRFEGQVVRDLTTEVNLQNGTLTLTTLRASIPHPDDPTAKPGVLSGSATAALDPVGDATASLTLDRVPVGPVVAAVPGLGLAAAGIVTGKADFRAPFDKLADPATWAATATVRSEELTIAGRTAKAVALTAVVAKGTATLREAAATLEGIPVTATGTLALEGAYKFTASVKTTGTSVTDLRKLVPELELPVPVEGVLETTTAVAGTLSPRAFNASGRVTATELTLGKTTANRLAFKWEVADNHLKLTDLDAGVFGGTATGTLDYPFDPKQTGSFAIALKDVDAAAAAAFAPDFPVRITGAVSGKVAGAIPAAKDGEARIGDLDVALTAPKLTVQGIPAQRLEGKATVKGGAVEYALEGKTLGGSFDIKGRYPGAGKKGPAKGERGRLRVEDIDLSRLAGVLRMESLGPLAGRVDVTFDFANDLSSGAGRVLVRGLTWGNEQASEEVIGVLILRDGFVELRDFGGSLAGGLLRGRGRVQIDHPARNFFTLALDRADGRRLFAPFPDLAGLVVGQVSAVVRGTVGRETRGSGSVTIVRGSVSGANVSEFRIPFDFATSPGGYGRLTVREATTQAGTGRATGGITVDWGATVRVSGQVRFIDVPLGTVSPGLGDNRFFGSGRITGKLDLAGTDMRSIDDLSGTLIATLSNASPQEIPFIRKALPFLNPLGLGKPFQSGDIHGTLGRGVFRIQRLALANPSAQLFAEGSISLSQNRLDLDVVARVGQSGPEVRGFRLLALRVPSVGPIPVGLIREVSGLLTNRAVRLTITGTVANPSVRLNTGAMLGSEAVRFLLTRYTPGGVGAGF